MVNNLKEVDALKEILGGHTMAWNNSKNFYVSLRYMSK